LLAQAPKDETEGVVEGVKVVVDLRNAKAFPAEAAARSAEAFV
jgi:hypothetical protein